MLFSTPPHPHTPRTTHTHTGLILYMSMEDAQQMQMRRCFEQVWQPFWRRATPITAHRWRSVQVFWLGLCCTIYEQRWHLLFSIAARLSQLQQFLNLIIIVCDRRPAMGIATIFLSREKDLDDWWSSEKEIRTRRGRSDNFQLNVKLTLYLQATTAGYQQISKRISQYLVETFCSNEVDTSNK